MELPPFNQDDFDKYRQSKPIIKVRIFLVLTIYLGM